MGTKKGEGEAWKVERVRIEGSTEGEKRAERESKVWGKAGGQRQKEAGGGCRSHTTWGRWRRSVIIAARCLFI